MLHSNLQKILALSFRIGAHPDDSEAIRLKKALLVSGSLMFIAAGLLWGLAYIWLGEPLAGAIPFSYGVFSSLSIAYFAVTRRFALFRFSQLLLILLLPFFLMVALGGFINSGAVILWSFISPLGALLFDEPPRAPRWLLAYFGLLVLSGFLQPYVRVSNNLPTTTLIPFFILNIGTVTGIAFALLYFFVGQKDLAFRLLQLEQEKSESLLLNILPKEIASRLKDGKRTIADYYASASILFADMVGFTRLTSELAPTAMVELINHIYSRFDSLVEKYGVEKIRTIGDNYMIASGLPRQNAAHALVLARLALEMMATLQTLPPVGGQTLSFRIGINAGPVIAGIVGHKKFQYDVWGDAVNVASRMENTGEPGKIQITQAFYELIKDEFICEPKGQVAVKGKGTMETWFLVGEK
jgi:guanylate cyclase